MNKWDKTNATHPYDGVPAISIDAYTIYRAPPETGE